MVEPTEPVVFPRPSPVVVVVVLTTPPTALVTPPTTPPITLPDDEVRWPVVAGRADTLELPLVSIPALFVNPLAWYFEMDAMRAAMEISNEPLSSRSNKIATRDSPLASVFSDTSVTCPIKRAPLFTTVRPSDLIA